MSFRRGEVTLMQVMTKDEFVKMPVGTVYSVGVGRKYYHLGINVKVLGKYQDGDYIGKLVCVDLNGYLVTVAGGIRQAGEGNVDPMEPELFAVYSDEDIKKMIFALEGLKFPT